MSRTDPARELLFGLLAFQNNFIDRAALLAAFNDWIADKSRAIGDGARSAREIKRASSRVDRTARRRSSRIA